MNRTRDYRIAVEISKTRQLFKYDRAAYCKDWELAVALTYYLAEGKEHFRTMFDECFIRILAYHKNTDTLPFEEHDL